MPLLSETAGPPSHCGVCIVFS